MKLGRRQFLTTSYAATGVWLYDGLLSSAWAAGSVTVRKGDTLWQLAREYGIRVEDLKRANDLSTNTLRIGQTLKLPASGATSPGSVIVKKGDTLGRIAERNGVSVADLKEANRIQGHLIHPGDRLKLPISSGEGKRQKTIYVDRARSRIDVANLSERRWKHIILHHSGTPTGSGKIFDYYHRRVRHMENGLAYHFVIGNGSESGDGEIEVAERWRRQIQGGHVKSDKFNQNSIGICLVGNFQKTRPTKKQMAAAVELVDHLKNGLLRRRPDLLLHRDIQETICPGRFFPEKEVHRIFG